MYSAGKATWYGGDDKTQTIWEESTQIVERFMETIDASVQASGHAIPTFPKSHDSVVTTLAHWVKSATDHEIEQGEHNKEGWTEDDALTNVELTAEKIEVSEATGEVLVHNAKVHGDEWTVIVEDELIELPVE
ncbi:hypothetical protein L198_02545 [Cryptococcus wingfieldii CBS 7118]|uniref:Uncharacterized protein n=1 Tax=Cryptococcus wingfieldii CBS 7118 TaxID=1295528 RepID=A0A1E3JLT8_9TREE|nr:hypothetical protein L198_02545 [Cryptococcus wingfieldii CBS 7118]ODO01818.1 hypothetical protein L198_02545 [Cryptococcus wingfieldii CBS 7118]